MPPFHRADGYNERDLLRAAIDHLEAAQHLFGQDPGWYDSAGYLGHLGIELLLKAYLLAISDSFPNEHSLKKLWSQLVTHKPDATLSSDEERILHALDRLYHLRYPRPSDPVEIGTEDWPLIERTTLTIVDLMPELLQREFETIREPTKGGRILMRRRRE